MGRSFRKEIHRDKYRKISRQKYPLFVLELETMKMVKHPWENTHKLTIWWVSEFFSLIKLCEFCELLCHWRRPGVFIVSFEHNTQLFPVFLLVTLNKQMLALKSLWSKYAIVWKISDTSELMNTGNNEVIMR